MTNADSNSNAIVRVTRGALRLFRRAEEREPMCKDVLRLFRKHHRLSAELEHEIGQVSGRAAMLLRCGDLVGARACIATLQQLQIKHETLRELAVRPASCRRHIVVNTWMLARSLSICNALREEGMHLVAGIDYEGSVLATEILQFSYAYRAVTGAMGDHAATHRLAIQAHEIGQILALLIHSHPGSGRDANHPSSTDMRTQRSWERTTPIVGGIWERGGTIRFFSDAVDFEIEVLGEGVEQLEERVFRLDLELAEFCTHN